VTISTPGPGAYEISKDIRDSIKKSFTKDEKLVQKGKNHPPLGTYKINYK